MKHRRSRGRQALMVFCASAGVLAPFFLYVWSHVQIVTIGYRIEETEARLRELQQQNRALRLERASLESLPIIEARARLLGLEPLPPTRLLVITRPRLSRASSGERASQSAEAR